jgi:hypothetical protein
MFSYRVLGIALVGAAFGAAMSSAVAADGASFEVYGFAQADYIQDFNRVNPKWMDAFRPSRIPATEGQFGSDGQASLSAKQSRFGVQASAPLEGSTLYTKFEFDFFGVGVDEGQTTPRLRHAYGQWGQWLGGMTHSLFMDADLFPNVLDYWGPTGMVFFRLPQIRWTPVQSDVYSFAIAIEKPGDDIDYGMLRQIDPAFGTNMQTDEKMPDVTAQWRTAGDWGHFQIAGIYRRIGYENTVTADHKPSSQKDGYGIDVSTVVRFLGSEKVYLSVVSGQGIASYMNDGGMDLAPDGTVADPVAKAVPLTGLMAYYEHAWTEKWMSTIGVSQTEVKNTELQAADAYNRGQYASLNILSTPAKNVLAGAEFLWGSRKSKDGTTNDDSRIQISMKYSFSSKDFK